LKSGFEKEVTTDAANYIAEIHLHLLNPEMAIKTEENLHVFVREVFA
jgi:hypothetical protein